MKKIWWYLIAGLAVVAAIALTLIGLVPKTADRKTIRELVEEQARADQAKEQVRAKTKEQLQKIDVVYKETKRQLRTQLQQRLQKIEQDSKASTSQKEAFDKEADAFEGELDRELRQEGDV